ncbi:PHD and RING finger domain-containing protein 1 isoform X2 [Megalobrama amblycephala]|uniref:PHD and RING finger domain-containing protein 1 isoform X2 n=1 Tax=Megalobrama amblycephala TaxID=75352 RepID=UPI002013F15C|nr:PHD and RING finger domain-containing protein 1 isoform X2 [Megalobrama amblycephala]
MDEEDSQDELINRNVSHGKGKRPAMSIISDDEDDSEDEGESEEGETGSEEDDDDDEVEDVLDGEEEEEDDEGESENEDSVSVLEGAAGNVPVDAAGLSSDEDSEKCPICLNSFHEQPVATPESCEHYFCLDCILEWSKNANSCPVDRIVFNNILLRKCHGGKVQKTIAVKKPVKPGEEQVDVDLDQTSCEVCGGRDREDRLLLCDGCDAGYHMECLTPPLDAVPVEEWFCPECIANNRTSGSEQISEEESSSLPTTSRSQSRPTRAIARTQQSERVRANVNRHRITQLAPRYMMQSTWLDETINAVVAGLNTAVYVRDLTPRPRPRRRRKTVKRRKTKSKSSAVSEGKTTKSMGVRRRRKRKVRKSKLRRKLVKKKETNSRGRIARNLGIKKPKPGSIIPSVYRPSEYSLGSMRAEIGAASLSVYGDPFDLDPFDDREDEIQVPTPSSVLDAKRRGLSRSALRSHQPVARPISAGLSRQGVSIPQVEAPVPDLLGSILSGQSMLLMDSSDVVINRDGSLKATKPVSLSLPRNTTPRESSSGETANTPNSETSPIHPFEQPGPSSSPLRRSTPVHNSHGSCSTPQNPTSPPIHSPLLPHSHPSPLGQPHLHPGALHRPITLNPPRPGNGHLSTNGIRGQPLSRVSNSSSDSPHQDKEGTARQPPVRKPPPKPVWVDVSVLPRIPKIKRDSTSSANSSSDSSSSTLPGSSATSLAGNTGRERTVDQQGMGTSQQNRTVDAQRQRADRTGASSSFSSSFTSTTSSFSASANSRPSSSSVSFRINTSGNPWQARRLPASGGTLPGNDEESLKKSNKSKQILLSLKRKVKEEKCEVYDPFNPTGSDSSDNEPEGEGLDVGTQNTESQVAVGVNEDACHQIKSEPMSEDSDMERDSEMCAEVKTEPDPCRDEPCKQSPHHSDTIDSQATSGASINSTICEASIDPGSHETPESPFRKTQEHSRSSSSCSDRNVKLEVKSEPEAKPPPVRPQSKSLEESLANLQQASKGNGVCKELPSVSGAFNATNIMERPHQSQCKDRKRSPSTSQSLSSKDSHKKKHSRSKEKRRSRSRSRDRRRSRSKSKERQRSRSKERRRQRSRDRRCSSSSSSRERKTSGRRVSRERNDNRGRERRKKRSKERRRSRSFSRSRSRERRRTSKDKGDNRLKRQKSRSRSTSRERKRREDRSETSRRTERSSHKSAEPMSTELHEPTIGSVKSTTTVKTEKDARAHEYGTASFKPSIKQETRLVDITTYGLGSSRHSDQTRAVKESKEEVSLELLKLKKLKQEEPRPISAVKELKDLKKEEDLGLNLYGELDVEIATHGLGSSKHGDRTKTVKESKENVSLELLKPKKLKREEPLPISAVKELKDFKKEEELGLNLYGELDVEIATHGLGSSKHGDQTTTVKESKEDVSFELLKPKKIKEEEPQPISTVKELKDFKEEELGLNLYGELDGDITTHGLGSSKHSDQITTVKESKEEVSLELLKPKQFKQEEPWPISAVKELKDFKQEEELGLNCGELYGVKEMKNEEMMSLNIFSKESPNRNEINLKSVDLEKSLTGFQDEMQVQEMVEPKQNKIEQIWPDEDDSPSCRDNPLVISLDTPDIDAVNCKKEPTESYQSPLLEEDMELSPLQPPDPPIKQEPVMSSDEDISVDYLIDNLDFIKKEMSESSVADSTEDPKSTTPEAPTGNKQITETVAAGAKSKPQGKRVTWNLQEPVEPQSEKLSKLALFKLKLKQEGSRRSATSQQTSSQDKALSKADTKLTATVSSLPPQDESSKPKSRKEAIQDPNQKDKYMKKLHMQERAIEEVKLAIKPFYQKRDITKEEYKEILRKAVQKVCHSKSGEINPVKVVNLVKAYVDKYKHARKHKKDETGQSQNADVPKDFQTSV